MRVLLQNGCPRFSLRWTTTLGSKANPAQNPTHPETRTKPKLLPCPQPLHLSQYPAKPTGGHMNSTHIRSYFVHKSHSHPRTTLHPAAVPPHHPGTRLQRHPPSTLHPVAAPLPHTRSPLRLSPAKTPFFTPKTPQSQPAADIQSKPPAPPPARPSKNRLTSPAARKTEAAPSAAAAPFTSLTAISRVCHSGSSFGLYAATIFDCTCGGTTS